MQALLLSTLSLADEEDDDENEQIDTDERITSATGDDDIVNVVSPSSNTTSCDSITPTAPRDEYETKKQLESASHSEYDSQQQQQQQPQQRGPTTKPSQSQAKSSKAASDRPRSNVHANSQQSATQAPTSQPKTARELKATTKEVLPDTR